MVNNFDITFGETVDPRGVNCGEEHYNDYGCSRDPERTPFQWDATGNAGFTTALGSRIEFDPQWNASTIPKNSGNELDPRVHLEPSFRPWGPRT